MYGEGSEEWNCVDGEGSIYREDDHLENKPSLSQPPKLDWTPQNTGKEL